MAIFDLKTGNRVGTDDWVRERVVGEGGRLGIWVNELALGVPYVYEPFEEGGKGTAPRIQLQADNGGDSRGVYQLPVVLGVEGAKLLRDSLTKFLERHGQT